MIKHLILFFLPLIITNVMHMFVVKKNLFIMFNRPIMEQEFGANKTWRGLLFVTCMNGLLVTLFNIPFQFVPMTFSIALGITLGLVYMLSELPNSFMKRKLGIEAGGKPDQGKYFFIFMDRFDSALGSVIAYSILIEIELIQALILLALSVIIHFSFSYLLFFLGIKKEL